ncbi:MAG: hypothetical protein IKH57_23050 [Clostridia bacterium]|nr:hypothetical protein [Clostridia bacterium]
MLRRIIQKILVIAAIVFFCGVFLSSMFIAVIYVGDKEFIDNRLVITDAEAVSPELPEATKPPSTNQPQGSLVKPVTPKPLSTWSPDE